MTKRPPGARDCVAEAREIPKRFTGRKQESGIGDIALNLPHQSLHVYEDVGKRGRGGPAVCIMPRAGS
ncbi:MAG: hypothetical protein H5T86_15115 [Armatimonadetes bacterium]|nr:hypothetical protein [Armatimonadota bacterium]